MKKLTLITAVVLMSSLAHAGGRQKDSIADIGPASVTLTVSTNIVVSAGGSGISNCLDYAIPTSTATFQFYILDGNTTSYYERVQPNSPNPGNLTNWCGSSNSTLTLKTTVITAGTETTVNYKGFRGR